MRSGPLFFSEILILSLVWLALAVMVGGLAWALWVNRRNSQGPEAIEFAKGQLPDPLPDGNYDGSQFKGLGRKWQGKHFDRAAGTGINLFTNGRRYSFVVGTGSGLTNQALQVFKINYNSRSNPVLLHLITDELVQVGPDSYLGKVQLRIPGEALTIAYFRLNRPPKNQQDH